MEINKEHFEKAMALQKAFDQGVQSQQQKIDEYAMVAEALDESYVRECKKNKELQNKIKELELINFDSELHFEAAKEKIYELQKRIDDALKELELLNYFRTGNSDNAIKILKGEPK